MDYFEILTDLVALGEKKTGSEANLMARGLIWNAIRDIGGDNVEYRAERFPLEVCSDGCANVQLGGESVPAALLDYTGGSDKPAKGKLAYLGMGNSLQFLVSNVRNKIVVCRSSLLAHRVVQAMRAYKKNAAGLIIISNHPSSFQVGIGQPGDKEHLPIPVFSVMGRAGYFLRKMINEEAEMLYSKKVDVVEGENIIVDIKNKKSTSFVVIGAHYDSWFGGAQDNCIAVVMLLSLIQELSRTPLTHNVRCVFFDAEELGLLGSKWHVCNNELQRYRFYFNLEMPLPCKQSLVKAIFFSSRGLMHIPYRKIIINKYLPIPIESFYWCGNKFFPADVDAFYKNKIPCMTTYCNNNRYHTKYDSIDNLETGSFTSVKTMLLDYVIGAAGAL